MSIYVSHLKVSNQPKSICFSYITPCKCINDFSMIVCGSSLWMFYSVCSTSCMCVPHTSCMSRIQILPLANPYLNKFRNDIDTKDNTILENHKTRLVHILYYSLNRMTSMHRHLYLSPLTTLKDVSNIMSMQRHVHWSLLLLIYHYNTETGATAWFHWYTIDEYSSKRG